MMYASTAMNPTVTDNGSRAKKMLKRFGIAGFAFFFIKGLLWLLIPAAVYWFKG